MTNCEWALAEYGRQGLCEADCLVYAYYMTCHSSRKDSLAVFAEWLIAEHVQEVRNEAD